MPDRPTGSAKPPSGTVTFLFTDVEGSTKLWEAHAKAMTHALARHDMLLRHAIEKNRGYVFKTVGSVLSSRNSRFADLPQSITAPRA